MKKIVIVGGGVCGISTAYHLKKHYPSDEVILLEKDSSIGNRIKVSGNGRCNFSNENISDSDYKNGDKIKNILSIYQGYEEEFYQQIHLYYYHDEEGRRYPISNSSKTVLFLLTEALKQLGVKILTDTSVIDIEKKGEQIRLILNQGVIVTDIAIITSGGASYFYSCDNYNFLQNLGLKFTNISPSLCPIILKEKIDKSIVGKRAKVNVKLFHDNKLIFCEKGEIIFKKDGISGIVIFNVSSYINRYNLDINRCELHIDFIPEINILELNRLIEQTSLSFAYKSLLCAEISEYLLLNVSYNEEIKDKIYHLKDLYPLRESQVTSGGISCEEINFDNLSLKRYPNIFVGGEVIDVDGKCGGYNIHFALACGYFIAKNLENKKHN